MLFRSYLIFATDTQSILFRNRIGDIYRTLGEYDRAELQYKEIINDYPLDAFAYISLSTMLLMDMKDIEGAVEYYEEAKRLNGIDVNSNFISLKSKLQNLGVI